MCVAAADLGCSEATTDNKKAGIDTESQEVLPSIVSENPQEEDSCTEENGLSGNIIIINLYSRFFNFIIIVSHIYTVC